MRVSKFEYEPKRYEEVYSNLVGDFHPSLAHVATCIILASEGVEDYRLHIRKSALPESPTNTRDFSALLKRLRVDEYVERHIISSAHTTYSPTLKLLAKLYEDTIENPDADKGLLDYMTNSLVAKEFSRYKAEILSSMYFLMGEKYIKPRKKVTARDLEKEVELTVSSITSAMKFLRLKGYVEIAGKGGKAYQYKFSPKGKYFLDKIKAEYQHKG